MGSTRLIVKNLPNTATEAKLKELFDAKGTVTDVQLKRFDDGRSRHFAFVGFKTTEEADNAREYFNKAYFGACKMQVDTCYALNDPSRPKAWSKHAQKKDQNKTGKKEKAKHRKEEEEEDDDEDEDVSKPKKIKRKEEELLEKAKVDPDFLEFLEVHSKNKAKWGNDTVLDTLEKLVPKQKSKKDDKKKKELKSQEQVEYEDEDDSEEEQDSSKSSKVKVSKGKKKASVDETEGIQEKVYPEDTFFTVKIRNLPKKTRKKDMKAFFSPLVPKSIRTPPNLRGFAYVGFLTEAEQKKALSKHRSIMLGNQISVKKYISREVAANSLSGKLASRWQSQTDELIKQTEGVEESGRIFVRNLAYTAVEDDLRAEFEKFGPVTEVHLPVDRITRQSKGFAFVSFLLPEHAAKAFETLDGTTFQGRMLHLLPSKAKEEISSDGAHGGSSFKREKELKMKKAAGSSHNWNSLFLGQNAVSAVVSEKYGVSREQLLLDNNDSYDDRLSSVAVRMALAETEIVSETKKFLESQGVCLEAFELGNVNTERSTTAILVKNLVAYTTEEEIREVFEKHGVLGRVVLPQSGITAIVEFMVAAEARAAFKKLAYSKFKSIPLYLEWAPVDVFRVTSDGSKISVKSTSENENPQKSSVTPETTTINQIKLPNYSKDQEPFDENMVPESETTLFVKNLNFSTTEEEIKKHFSTIGRIFAATIAKKKDPKNPGQMLSQGFGFVQYYRAKDAAAALSCLNQTMVKNHLLELKFSSRTLQSETPVDKSAQSLKGTKLLVRNVPFQANETEITDLFKVFGKLKAIRMPKKAMGDSQHRGFAFIDFFIEANASAAFETLSKSTHIYGRRLVLEWAQKDASVEELREKVAKQYDRQQSGEKSTASGSSTKKQLKRYFDTQSSKSDGGTEQQQQDEEEDD